MSLSHDETKDLLKRLIFGDSPSDEWVQDVWALSPTLGETAARLVDAFDGVVDCTQPEKLENLLNGFYQEQLEE
ncbi:hypothetical protein PN498_21535 [Oscillatoria sp. CS-180]|nr:hypothetical protein [Oscillatoria sp. CS-180]MDB9528590.1 hypothetical protein [Oscillatoria sp. CS-180]